MSAPPAAPDRAPFIDRKAPHPYGRRPKAAPKAAPFFFGRPFSIVQQ